jgi:hypothetical protein
LRLPQQRGAKPRALEFHDIKAGRLEWEAYNFKGLRPIGFREQKILDGSVCRLLIKDRGFAPRHCYLA